jgi:hypothetical protein
MLMAKVGRIEQWKLGSINKILEDRVFEGRKKILNCTIYFVKMIFFKSRNDQYNDSSSKCHSLKLSNFLYKWK